jgi:NADPH-dependent curcumin reductase CurA
LHYRDEQASGPARITRRLDRRPHREGCITWDRVSRFPEFSARFRMRYTAGRVRRVAGLGGGIEAAPGALQKLFTGANRGIRLVRVSADPD